MTYYWVIFNQGTPDSFVGDIVEWGELTSFELTSCKAVGAWPANATIAAGPNGTLGVPDDVLQTSEPVPIFSARLRSTLDEAGVSGIQYLPIRLVQGRGASENEYYVANVLKCVPALDTSASELTLFPSDYFLPARRGKVSGLRRPVLRMTEALADCEVFRLSEYLAPMFVSERFRDIYRLGKFRGIGFEPVPMTSGAK